MSNLKASTFSGCSCAFFAWPWKKSGQAIVTSTSPSAPAPPEKTPLVQPIADKSHKTTLTKFVNRLMKKQVQVPKTDANAEPSATVPENRVKGTEGEPDAFTWTRKLKEKCHISLSFKLTKVKGKATLSHNERTVHDSALVSPVLVEV